MRKALLTVAALLVAAQLAPSPRAASAVDGLWQATIVDHGDEELSPVVAQDGELRRVTVIRIDDIAHGVETDFWEEAEVPVKRGKKASGATKLEWRPRQLS